MSKDFHKFTEKDVPDLTGYVDIVTGGISGIGYETTRQLALAGARVYIASRNPQRIEDGIKKMQESAEGKKVDLHALKMNLDDLKSVKATAEGFCGKESRLDLLINNAGIMNSPYALTGDGHERQWQVDFVAPHVFKLCLLPLLVATAASSPSKDRVRVVNVFSDLAIGGPDRIDLKNPKLDYVTGIMAGRMRYGHSKQAVIREAHELNEGYAARGVTGYVVHPGITRIGLQDGDPSAMGSVIRTVMSPQAPAHGAGKFMMPVAKVQIKADPWLKDAKGNKELWEYGEAELRKLGES